MGVYKKNNEVTLKGIIIVADWDENNNIVTICLSTPGEKDYIIENNGVEKELLGILGEEVTVTGIIKKDEFGKKIIAVERYKTLEINKYHSKGKKKDNKKAYNMIGLENLDN